MAEDKGKKKGKSKKDKPEPRNWAKIGLQVFILLVIVMAVLGFTLNFRGNNSNTNTGTSKTDKSFNNIEDALKVLPVGATYVRYVDMGNDTAVSDLMNTYYPNTLPPAQIFGARVVKDALSIFPIGYFGDVRSSSVGTVLSLSDFGGASLNQSYPWTNSNTMRKVNDYYYFTPETSPVISGSQNSVTYTLETMTGNIKTSYSDYSDLFGELRLKNIPIDNMTLEAVGTNATFPISNVNLTVDKFYAGMGATNQTIAVNNSTYTKYSYVVILHVDKAPSSNDSRAMYILSTSNEKMGFGKYNVEIYDDYIVIEAEGPMVLCAEDMTTWGFLRYMYGT